MPRANADAFEAAVRAASGKADAKAIAAALGKLVKAKLASRQRPTQPSPAIPPRTFAPAAPTTTARNSLRRRSVRRGKNQRYAATGKVDISRLGTYRHYMLRVIREHDNTWAAEAAHAQCDNPKFAKNRLDFGWAAAEGFITLL
jgi:hypothetical protein